MKTSFFSEVVEIPSYPLVSATIQTANLALFKAISATMWEHRGRATPESRAEEVASYFNTSTIPSTSAYEPIPRSSGSKWAEAWVVLVAIATASARAAECGKALEKLMRPQDVALKFGKNEPKGVPTEILDKLSPELGEALRSTFKLAAEKGHKKEASRASIRDIADATEAAKEIDILYKQLQGNAEIDLYPQEIAQLVTRYATQLKEGLQFALEQGFYSRKGEIDPQKAGELAIELDCLRIAELTQKLLVDIGCEDDCEDFDAAH